MSRQLIGQLDDLKSRLARMSASVQQVVESAVESVFTLNRAQAKAVIESDSRIDDEEVKVEQSAINILATQQPAATDLRYLMMVIKVNSELERIADCAVNAAQRVLPLAAEPNGYHPPEDLRILCETVISTLRDTIKAFNLGDVDVARRVLRGDDVVDALYHQIVQDMLSEMEENSQQAQVDLSTIMIAKNFERIGDHCTNIAEDVIYVRSGQIIRHIHAIN